MSRINNRKKRSRFPKTRTGNTVWSNTTISWDQNYTIEMGSDFEISFNFFKNHDRDIYNKKMKPVFDKYIVIQKLMILINI
jgi:hypothetical protein